MTLRSPAMDSANGLPNRQSPIFIVGTQRSGTTLLFQMLNSHSKIDIINELDKFYPHVEQTGQRSELVWILSKVLAVSGKDLDIPGADPFDMLEAAFGHRLARSGKQWWGIKDPALTYWLPAFINRYPHAKFVFTLRDPRSVVNSYVSRPLNVANCYHGAALWTKEVELQREFRNKYPDNCLLVRYEDLIAKKIATLHAITDFLGIEYESAMEEFYSVAAKTRVHSGTVNITRDVDQRLTNKWQSELSARQIKIIESVASDAFAKNGYQTISARRTIGPLEKLVYDVHQWAVTTYLWQRRTNFSGVRKRIGLFWDQGTINQVGKV